MSPKDDPRIVSLEAARRRRLADARAKAAAKPKPHRERAINWRKAPMFLAAVVLFMLFSWAIHSLGSVLNPFH